MGVKPSVMGLAAIAPCLSGPGALLANYDMCRQPQTRAFWSATRYDSANDFFTPNKRLKYSVGESAGFLLVEQGDIAVCLGANQPDGVPEKHGLPALPRKYAGPLNGADASCWADTRIFQVSDCWSVWQLPGPNTSGPQDSRSTIHRAFFGSRNDPVVSQAVSVEFAR